MPTNDVAFISSTARDLPEHRREVMAACLIYDYRLRMMEHLPACDDDAIAASLRMVDEAEVYVGIFAHRYGYVPAGHSISITEMEYDRAVERNIPRLLFFMRDDHTLRVGDVETGPGAERLKVFKERMAKERVVNFFSSPADLRACVISSLVALRDKSRSPTPASLPDRVTSPLRPAYRDDFTRDLSERAKQLRKVRLGMLVRGAGEAERRKVDLALLEMKRQLRNGPQLVEGDCLCNRYWLLDQLGSGGFGTVWKAFDEEMEHQVALKVLHGQYTHDLGRRERFIRGARAMQQLHEPSVHPNIVRILDRYREDGGYHYFVMEYLAGGTFLQAVIGNALTVEQRLDSICQVGVALGFAHSRGILHRDVSPDNILLVGPVGPARLSDFDLVRLPDSTGGTRTGALGKFVYTAPECSESGSDIDTRSDIYSLGMTAVFALSGKEFTPRAIMNRSQFFASLPLRPRIKEVLARATEPARDDRFGRVEDFCSALKEASASTRADDSIFLPHRRGTLLPSNQPSTSYDASLLLTLGEITQLVVHSYDSGETLDNIVRLIQSRFGTAVCSVYYLEPESGDLVLGATVGLEPEAVGRVRMSSGEGLTGLVAEELRPVMVPDAFAHPRFKYFPEAGQDPYQSFLGVPLIEGGSLQGVLVVQTVDKRTFQPNEIRMLVSVAAQLAPMVSGTRLLRHRRTET